MKKEALFIIAGPTAAGKSALAVELAKTIGGEVISGDSMQVYRGMDYWNCEDHGRGDAGSPTSSDRLCESLGRMECGSVYRGGEKNHF